MNTNSSPLNNQFPGMINPENFGFLSANTTIVNETDNNTVTFTLDITDNEIDEIIDLGIGETINAGDTFDLNFKGDISEEDVEGELPSTVTVEENGTATFDLTFSADARTESNENFFVEATFEKEEEDSNTIINLESPDITVQDSSQDASEEDSNENDNGNGNQEENDDNPLQMNTLTLDGSDQTLPIPFDVDIRGTSGAETVLVQNGVSVNFNAQSGDRVDVSQDLADYTIERTGLTELTFTENNDEDTISLTVNQDEEFEVRFADGNTTVNLNQEGVIIGSEVLGNGDQADPANITLGNELSEVGDNEVNDELAPLPNQGGPDEVSNGTANSDNIDGDQNDQTLSGDDSIDRFIFNNLVNDQGNPVDQEVIIDDFTEGEQLLFEGGFSQQDVTINNSEGDDGEVTLQISNTDITITGLSDQNDSQILNSSQFEEVFGNLALEFA